MAYDTYVASYVGLIQTGFLMAFLARFRQNRNRDSCSKRATGTKQKTGIRWIPAVIPAGIGNLVSHHIITDIAEEVQTICLSLNLEVGQL